MHLFKQNVSILDFFFFLLIETSITLSHPVVYRCLFAQRIMAGIADGISIYAVILNHDTAIKLAQPSKSRRKITENPLQMECFCEVVCFTTFFL